MAETFGELEIGDALYGSVVTDIYTLDHPGTGVGSSLVWIELADGTKGAAMVEDPIEGTEPE
jgi:hypothetical protein